jgi:hypothetical protein
VGHHWENNMNTRSLFVVATLPWAPVLASLWLAACGGASNDVAEPISLSAATTSQSQALKSNTVPLEGCVFNAQWGGASGVAVHARGADGRTLGTAFTNARGVYVMRVPAQSAVVLDTAVAGPGELSINTGSSPISVAACLLPEV